VEIRYGTGAVQLLQDRTGRVTGVTAQDASGLSDLPARAVVLALQGEEAASESLIAEAKARERKSVEAKM